MGKSSSKELLYTSKVKSRTLESTFMVKDVLPDQESPWEEATVVLYNSQLKIHPKQRPQETIDLCPNLSLSSPKNLSNVIILSSETKTLHLKAPNIGEFIEWKYSMIVSMRPTWAYQKFCSLCHTKFSLVTRQHHCRSCGQVVCGKCSPYFSSLKSLAYSDKVRICRLCSQISKQEKHSDPFNESKLDFSATSGNSTPKFRKSHSKSAELSYGSFLSY